ncbi:MAG: hypothetical protein NC120_06255 [Ruminococcus sp.]|nr:hypothetical protein [Ruminococcus sp.]
MNMNYTENSVLSIEEKILLSSLEETDTDKCIKEIDRFAMTVPFTDETFAMLMILRFKLKHGNVNIAEEISSIHDDEDFSET